jgi:hypothetical protein
VALFLGALLFIITQLADTPAGEPARLGIINADSQLHGLILALAAAYITFAAGATTIVSASITGFITLASLAVFFWFIAHPVPVSAVDSKRR